MGWVVVGLGGLIPERSQIAKGTPADSFLNRTMLDLRTAIACTLRLAFSTPRDLEIRPLSKPRDMALMYATPHRRHISRSKASMATRSGRCRPHLGNCRRPQVDTLSIIPNAAPYISGRGKFRPRGGMLCQGFSL